MKIKFLIVLSLLLSFNAFSKELVCEYNFGNSSLSFNLKDLSKDFFKKEFTENELIHKVFVNLKNLDSYDNYLVISDGKRKMTYILECSFN